MPHTTSSQEPSISYSSFVLGIVVGLLLVAIVSGFATLDQLMQRSTTSATISNSFTVAHVPKERVTSEDDDEKDTHSTNQPNYTDASELPSTKKVQVTDPASETIPASTQPATDVTPPSDTPSNDDNTDQKQLLEPVQKTASKLLDAIKSIEVRL